LKQVRQTRHYASENEVSDGDDGEEAVRVPPSIRSTASPIAGATPSPRSRDSPACGSSPRSKPSKGGRGGVSEREARKQPDSLSPISSLPTTSTLSQMASLALRSRGIKSARNAEKQKAQQTSSNGLHSDELQPVLSLESFWDKSKVPVAVSSAPGPSRAGGRPPTSTVTPRRLAESKTVPACYFTPRSSTELVVPLPLHPSKRPFALEKQRKDFMPAFAAVRAGNMQLLRKTFDQLDPEEALAAVSFKTQQGTTLLHIAAMNGHLEVVRILLGKSEFLNQTQKERSVSVDGVSPRKAAVAKKKRKATVTNLRLREDVTCRPLRTIYEHPVNLRDDSDSTPLLCAVVANHWPVVKLLIENGANVTVRNKDGNGVSHVLAQTSANALSASKKQRTFRDIFEQFMHERVPFMFRNKAGELPMHVAGTKGGAGTLEVYLGSGCSPNIPTLSGDTLLHFAVQRMDVALTEVILKNGGDPNIANSQGQLPIDVLEMRTFSSREKSNESKSRIAKLLSPYQSRPELSPGGLHTAAVDNDVEQVATYVRAGRYLPLADAEGMTALHHAIIRRHWKFALALLSHHPLWPSVVIQNKVGCTPMHYLVRQTPVAAEIPEYDVLLHYFILKGMPFDNGNDRMETPLHLAALSRNHFAISRILASIRKTTNIDSLRTVADETPLHYAIIGQDHDVIRSLLQRGCDPSSKYNYDYDYSESALELALNNNLLIRRPEDVK